MGSDKPEDNEPPKTDQSEAVEKISKGGLFEIRSCTDCPMILLAFVFTIGWIIILAVAVSQGSPRRMLLPSNFRGDLCGDKQPLTDYPKLWIPRASRLSYGLCVESCPAVGDYVCNNDVEPEVTNRSRFVPNHYYNTKTSEYTSLLRATFNCYGTCSASDQEKANKFFGLKIKIDQYKCFQNWYSSGATLGRCLPFQDDRDNVTLAQALGESSEALTKLTDYVGVSQFFNRGFSETQQSWLVILLSCLTCCGISIIWIFLLRWIMKPIVYLCILLILALLIIVGYLAMRMADDLENVKLPGDTATENQVKLWRALQYAAWILAAMYIIVMLWMIKRIKIAIAIMREASYIFLDSPSMVLIPPVVFIFVCGWVAFFIVSTIYIQTIGDLNSEIVRRAAVDTFGDNLVNFTLLAANKTIDLATEYNVTGNGTTFNASQWSTSEKIKWLHAYNFFGFLWASNFCICYGFFVMAMTGAVYYYSATQKQMRLAEDGKSEEEGGKRKSAPFLTSFASFLAVLRYHLGTLLFGSLLIAIIQFVRALFLYVKEQFLDEWKDTCSVGCLIKIIEYCLWYIQKVVEIISKNAFIICAIKSTSFCTSAQQAVSLIGGNGARVGVLTTLSAVACFVLKVFIVGCNMIIAWAFINTKSLTQNRSVESGLFPLFGILLISFIIASIFVNVYESCVDTVLMCFLVDESDFGGAFMPNELAELVGMFESAELARRDYERKLREASTMKRGEAKKA